jgi:TonB family protein
MKTERIRSDWVGQVVDGRFTLLQWLGGSEGNGVFLTELHGHGSQKAAIKLIPADGEDAEARIARWGAAATFSHPHVMRLFHYGRCQANGVRLLYAVTEYAEEILSQILPARPLNPAEAIEMLDPVLGALSYLHGKGFVHGRLKPSNIMAVDDRLKLSSDDLQIAGQPAAHVEAQAIRNAPENAAGPITPAADLWSLGVTLVEALTQHLPIWNRPAQSDPVVPESIPQPLAAIVLESLKSDPERRCTLRRIRVYLGVARFLPGFIIKARGMTPAKLVTAALVVLALFLAAVVALPFLLSHKTQPSPPIAVEQPAPAAVPTPPPSPPSPPPPVSQTQNATGGTVKGAVAQQVQPDVPQKASQTIHGKVLMNIRVTVNPGGEVSDAALDSPGPSKYFAGLALQAARRWRFKPAQIDGKAVSSEWLLRFDFGPAGTVITPVETSP